MRILITGASGFIGSFVVEEALARGMEVWAAVRATSSRRYLQDSRIHLIELDFSSEERLREALAPHSFDYIVHTAGLTKSVRPGDFMEVNAEGTRRLAAAVVATGMPLRRLVFLSSLSVMGAIREQQPYTEITAGDEPRPNTAYGRSKLQAERYLRETGGRLPYVVLRPTGVYGPRERDYRMMADSIRHHLDFAVGYRRQDITFIYVRDLVQAIFLALDHGRTGATYLLGDGRVYRSADFSRLLRRALGNPWVLRITAPVWLLRLVALWGDMAGRLTGRAATVNSDKYHIMRQRNWRCDITPARDELGYRPQYPLGRGVAETYRH